METITELINGMNQTIPGENQVFVDKRERIMTRKEAHEFLKNKKVYVKDKSKEIQKKLFEAGFAWAFEKKVQYIDKPYLYTSDDGNITHGTNTRNFYFFSKQQEITAEEILTIDIDEEHDFKPFDKVLYKFYESDDTWRLGFYSHYDGKGHNVISCGRCKEILPYEGNEEMFLNQFK